MPQSPEALSRRYVAWLRRHVVAVIVGHLAALGLAGYLIAFKLPLYADFSYLLAAGRPGGRRSAPARSAREGDRDDVVVVEAPTPEARAAVGEGARRDSCARCRKQLVDGVEDDDAEIRGFLRDHRYLFVPLADLENARDALAERIKSAKLHANPLYVDLDDDGTRPMRAAQKQLDELRAQAARRRGAARPLQSRQQGRQGRDARGPRSRSARPTSIAARS